MKRRPSLRNWERNAHRRYSRLQWATPVMLAHLLILAMMLAHWLEIAVQAVSYWRERH